MHSNQTRIAHSVTQSRIHHILTINSNSNSNSNRKRDISYFFLVSYLQYTPSAESICSSKPYLMCHLPLPPHIAQVGSSPKPCYTNESAPLSVPYAARLHPFIHPIHPQWYLDNSLSVSTSPSPSAFTYTQSTNAALPLTEKDKIPVCIVSKKGRQIRESKKENRRQFPYHGISSCCFPALFLSFPPISDLPTPKSIFRGKIWSVETVIKSPTCSVLFLVTKGMVVKKKGELKYSETPSRIPPKTSKQDK
jgi:hypothetical protein